MESHQWHSRGGAARIVKWTSSAWKRIRARLASLLASRKPPFHWLLPLAFFCVGLIYLYSAPHFEASDNDEHVGVIKWIAEEGTLPVQAAEHDHLHAQEASQPPLYYLLMSLVWSALDTSDFADFYQFNPLVYMGHPDRLGNRNLAFYRQPYPPDLHGTSLALICHSPADARTGDGHRGGDLSVGAGSPA